PCLNGHRYKITPCPIYRPSPPPRARPASARRNRSSRPCVKSSPTPPPASSPEQPKPTAPPEASRASPPQPAGKPPSSAKPPSPAAPTTPLRLPARSRQIHRHQPRPDEPRTDQTQHTVDRLLRAHTGLMRRGHSLRNHVADLITSVAIGQRKMNFGGTHRISSRAGGCSVCFGLIWNVE